MKQGQIQQQRDVQIQRLSPQQFLVAKLLELPLPDLEQRVRDEIYENVALEEGADRDPEQQTADDDQDDVFGQHGEETDGRESMDDDFSGLDEELPVYSGKSVVSPDAEIPIGDTRSFIEDLQAQMSDYDVSEHQRLLIDYLIGSLDDRGFVDRPLRNIADDLLFNHNVETDEHELEEALHVLQQFDPAGIGARDLQECLLIQIDRQAEASTETTHGETGSETLLQLERRIIAQHFALFSRNDTDRLSEALGVSQERLRPALHAISRLNPHPGRSLHEAADDRAQTIIPDFVVETDHESTVSFTLNAGEVPALRVSADYIQQLQAYQKSPSRLSRSQHEAFIYTKQKVESAQMFISAIRQRQQTLISTMQAIISLQRPFILTQDDGDLRPMRLIDVSERTGLNIATISRVVNSKYALVDGTLFPLKYFFLRTKNNAEGQEIAKNKIYPLLRDIVDAEDKRNPLSDEQISVLMREHGQAISRRTVAKYRDEMNIPVAALRRKL